MSLSAPQDEVGLDIPETITEFFENVTAVSMGQVLESSIIPPMQVKLSTHKTPFYLESDEELEIAESRGVPEEVVLRNVKATDKLVIPNRTISYTEVSWKRPVRQSLTEFL